MKIPQCETSDHLTACVTQGCVAQLQWKTINTLFIPCISLNIFTGSFECSLVQEALVQSFCQNHNKATECALAATKRQQEPSMFILLGKVQMKAKKHKVREKLLNLHCHERNYVFKSQEMSELF